MPTPRPKRSTGVGRWATSWLDRRIDNRIRERDTRVAPSTPTPGRAAASVYTLDYLLGAGRRSSRMVTAGQMRKLYGQITDVTGVEKVDALTRQAFRSLIEQEFRSIGRVAGGPPNILGKLVTTPLLRPPDGPILEIGTLFGVFAACLVRQFQRMGDARHITLVDPLVGHQVQADRAVADDDLSGSPVVPEVVRRNLELGGLARDEYRLIQGYSTDPEVKGEAGDRKYSVVVVDGDHSADGVYRDLDWVRDITSPGAILVLDDYGDPKWRGVRRGFERCRTEGMPFELVGVVSTSAFVRRTG